MKQLDDIIVDLDVVVAAVTVFQFHENTKVGKSHRSLTKPMQEL